MSTLYITKQNTKLTKKGKRIVIKEKKDIEWRDAIYYQFYETGWGVTPHYGIRTDRYKLIRFETDPVTWELYDLNQDPGEMHNLYGNSKYEEIRLELHTKLEELRKKYSLAGRGV